MAAVQGKGCKSAALVISIRAAATGAEFVLVLPMHQRAAGGAKLHTVAMEPHLPQLPAPL